MASREDSVKVAQLKMEAYGVARPMAEQVRDRPAVLQALVEVCWEFLSEQGRHAELVQLMQDGLNYLALGYQKLEQKAIEESARVATPRLAVVWNERSGPAACGICGNPEMTLRPGPELFVEGSPEPVCPRCAQRYQPHLAELMNLFRKNKAFLPALQATVAEHASDKDAPPAAKSDSQPALRKIKGFEAF